MTQRMWTILGFPLQFNIIFTKFSKAKKKLGFLRNCRAAEQPANANISLIKC